MSSNLYPDRSTNSIVLFQCLCNEMIAIVPWINIKIITTIVQHFPGVILVKINERDQLSNTLESITDIHGTFLRCKRCSHPLCSRNDWTFAMGQNPFTFEVLVFSMRSVKMNWLNTNANCDSNRSNRVGYMVCGISSDTEMDTN